MKVIERYILLIFLSYLYSWIFFSEKSIKCHKNQLQDQGGKLLPTIFVVKLSLKDCETIFFYGHLGYFRWYKLDYADKYFLTLYGHFLIFAPSTFNQDKKWYILKRKWNYYLQTCFDPKSCLKHLISCSKYIYSN